MPCYLFTLHAHGSWLPDRPRGYVRRGQGILPTDQQSAAAYRQRMTTPPITFTGPAQQAMIAQLLTACSILGVELRAVATDATHLHVLVSWRQQRGWLAVRTSLRQALSRRLNEQFTKQPWFSASGSRKRVEDRKHFDYLVNSYLPRHRGWKWLPNRGLFR